MTIKCFLVVPSGVARYSLRRYATGECPGPFKTFHNGHTALAEGNFEIKDGEYLEHPPVMPPKTDSRWPGKCDHCDYKFNGSGEYQVFADHLWRDQDGKLHSLKDGTPGMMWDAFWCHDIKEFTGPDGKSIHVICPDGSQWCIDARAKNCTMPKDNDHKCWVRHGELPNLTVDKNGKTCAAGGGSIAVKGYHGFLRDGSFT